MSDEVNDFETGQPQEGVPPGPTQTVVERRIEDEDDKNETSDTVPTQSAQAEDPKRPNMILANGKTPVTVNGPVNIGMNDPIELPSEEEQRAGFYAKDWAVFLQQFQGRYKPFTNKTKNIVEEGEGQNEGGQR